MLRTFLASARRLGRGGAAGGGAPLPPGGERGSGFLVWGAPGPRPPPPPPWGRAPLRSPRRESAARFYGSRRLGSLATSNARRAARFVLAAHIRGVGGGGELHCVRRGSSGAGRVAPQGFERRGGGALACGVEDRVVDEHPKVLVGLIGGAALEHEKPLRHAKNGGEVLRADLEIVVVGLRQARGAVDGERGGMRPIIRNRGDGDHVGADDREDAPSAGASALP